MKIEITTASGIHDVTTFPKGSILVVAEDDSRIMMVRDKMGRNTMSVYNMQYITHLHIDFEE